MNTETAEPPYQYYVYYRIRTDVEHDDLGASVRAMQASIKRATGITGRLLWRASDDRTWMEIYERVVDTAIFETTLQRETENAGVLSYIEPGSARHMERFVECA